MAHIQLPYSKLWVPQSVASNSDIIDVQKMFVDNIGMIENEFKRLAKISADQVQSISALKAINTTDTTLYTNGMTIMVKGNSVFYYDRDSVVAADDITVVQPTVGGGRWISPLKQLNTSITTSLDTKVDKVDGMALSENNFTNIHKNKLEGLVQSPYTKLCKIIDSGNSQTGYTVSIPVSNPTLYSKLIIIGFINDYGGSSSNLHQSINGTAAVGNTGYMSMGSFSSGSTMFLNIEYDLTNSANMYRNTTCHILNGGGGAQPHNTEYKIFSLNPNTITHFAFRVTGDNITNSGIGNSEIYLYGIKKEI